MRISALLLATCLLAASCQSPRSPTGPQTAPTELFNFGNYDRFPEEVVGFRRGKVIEYESPLRDYSVGYDIFNETLQNAVTLYFYPPAQHKAAQAQSEIAEILRAHAGAQMQAQRVTTLGQGSQSHEALVADFEYEQVFAGRRQRVWSRLILVSLPDRTVKVRSTAPLEQQAFASGKLMTFLERVQWAR